MKKYKYGDCIPESLKLYNRLKAQGKNPKIVAGWVEVNDGIDLEPDEKCLKLFFPDDLKEVKKNHYYMDYPRVIQHTWIKCNGEIIDPTKNQFDEYNGIVRYLQYYEYYFKGNKSICAMDAELGAGEIGKEELFIHYPDEKK